jgi:hypothetical protein
MQGLAMHPVLSYGQGPIFPHVLNMMPPLQDRPAPLVMYYPMTAPANNQADDKGGLRERNRVAAQKWREKKDHHLTELEAKNDSLRKQAFELNLQLQTLRLESNLLDSELTFFQGVMSKMMGGPM